MADAARTCATVDDFEWFLTHNLGRETMTRSNFLALDARGNASIFETHSRGFKRLNASETPEGYIGNTNFSRSGEPDKGHGYLRFDREAVLLKAAPSGRLPPTTSCRCCRATSAILCCTTRHSRNGPNSPQRRQSGCTPTTRSIGRAPPVPPSSTESDLAKIRRTRQCGWHWASR